MDRSDVIKLDPATAWLRDKNAQAVCRAISADGAAIYFVGGCVRDALLGIPDADIDLSTDATPEEVAELAKAAGLKAVPTGIDHGTVTIVSGGVGFEVTTFRSDIETDGRHAKVQFSKDIQDDARRRDFTMNALYATCDGVVVDPLGGVPDCLARRVRFIEDASIRIKEDYLRILRYFRFHAWYAPTDDGFDTDALDAISQNTFGLEKLSAERVGTEVRRLLSAPDPSRAVAAMRQTGCLSLILPGSDDRLLGPVVHLAGTIGLAIDPMVRLSALGGQDVADRLRLSKADRHSLERFTELWYAGPSLAETAYRHGAPVACGAAVLRAALASQPVATIDLQMIEVASKAVFPIKAQDLMPDYSGRALGDALSRLEALWIASDFNMTRNDLLNAL